MQNTAFRAYGKLNEKRYVQNPVDLTFQELVSLIKNPPAQLQGYIQQAREFDKYKNRTSYDDIKVNHIPYFIPCGGTNVIYLDIDNFTSTESALAHKDYLLIKHSDIILACWLSTSGYGLSILIKCDDLNKSNYNQYYSVLYDWFESQLDTEAKGFYKCCLISHDPEIYINPGSKIVSFGGGVSRSVFTLPDNDSYIYSNTSSIRGGEKLGIYLYCDTDLLTPPELKSFNYRTRIDDQEFENINTPIVLKEPRQILEINASRLYRQRIQTGLRQKTIGAISMQLIMLNPKATRKQIINALLNINKNYCQVALSVKEVINIFNSNYKKYKDQGNFLDIEKYKIDKYIIWHKDNQLSKSDKISIGQTKLLYLRGKGKQFNQEKIYEAIEALQDGINVITSKRISTYTGFSQDRVKTYWKEFKSLIDEYNAKIEASKMKEIEPVPAEVEFVEAKTPEPARIKKVSVKDIYLNLQNKCAGKDSNELFTIYNKTLELLIDLDIAQSMEQEYVKINVDNLQTSTKLMDQQKEKLMEVLGVYFFQENCCVADVIVKFLNFYFRYR